MMPSLLDAFDVDSVAFAVGVYRVSYLELVGTAFNLWSVWLVARASLLTWPVGNLGAILFAILFYQVRLYADLFEQIFFIGAGFYGWWVWCGRPAASGEPARTSTPRIATSSPHLLAVCAVAILIGTILLGTSMRNIHHYAPGWFPEPASFPYLDAFTTVMSLAATLLMAHKRLECWLLWISVDVIGVGLYWVKGIVIVALLYGMFLLLATQGFMAWRRQIGGRTEAT